MTENSMFPFGLRIDEPHNGYIGWRAIYTHRCIDIVPDRVSRHGEEASIDRLIAWSNKKPKGRKQLTPWQKMHDEVPKRLSGSSHECWEHREGNFVLRACPCASYGYLYIALFEIKDTDET